MDSQISENKNKRKNCVNFTSENSGKKRLKCSSSGSSWASEGTVDKKSNKCLGQGKTRDIMYNWGNLVHVSSKAYG